MGAEPLARPRGKDGPGLGATPPCACPLIIASKEVPKACVTKAEVKCYCFFYLSLFSFYFIDFMNLEN